jgi:hypothetical protein
MLGDRHGSIRSMDAPEGRCIRWRGDDDSFCLSAGAEDAFDEFLDFTATLADEPDHHHVGAGIPRHHAEEDTLPDTAPGEKTQSRAAADRKKSIDRSDPDIERLLDEGSPHRIDNPAKERGTLCTAQWSVTVDWLPTAVDHAAEQLRTDRDFDHPSCQHDAGSGGKPVTMTLGHEQDATAIEPDGLRRYQSASLILDKASLTDGKVNAARLHDEPDRSHQAATNRNTAVGGVKARPIAFEPLDQS